MVLSETGGAHSVRGCALQLVADGASANMAGTAREPDRRAGVMFRAVMFLPPFLADPQLRRSGLYTNFIRKRSPYLTIDTPSTPTEAGTAADAHSGSPVEPALGSPLSRSDDSGTTLCGKTPRQLANMSGAFLGAASVWLVVPRTFQWWRVALRHVSRLDRGKAHGDTRLWIAALIYPTLLGMFLAYVWQKERDKLLHQ
jgi:hypothetical protein